MYNKIFIFKNFYVVKNCRTFRGIVATTYDRKQASSGASELTHVTGHTCGDISLKSSEFLQDMKNFEK